MIALQNILITSKSHLKTQPQAGILSERAAIVICGLGVAVFAIPILVFLECLSGLYWGGATVVKLLKGSAIDELDEI